MTGNNNMELASMIQMTAEGIGRGGEVKFQDMNDWMYDYFLNVTDIGWTESKTTDFYAMAMLADDFFGLDFYHQFGAFAMVENGLHRTPEQIKNGLLNVAFPNLHKGKHTKVSNLITKAIRDNLPEELKKEIEEREKAERRDMTVRDAQKPDAQGASKGSFNLQVKAFRQRAEAIKFVGEWKNRNK